MSVGIILAEEELWKAFHVHQNEMIITRAGRCLFPLLGLKLLVCDLEGRRILKIEPDHLYAFAMGIERVDSMRWKYRQGSWQPVLSAAVTNTVGVISPEEQEDNHLLTAPESPLLGKEVEGEGGANLTWHRMKLSNRNTGRSDLQFKSPATDSQHLFTLHSFVRYRPVLYVQDLTLDPTPLSKRPAELKQAVQRFSWEEATFIAVTHYQNPTITNLKKSFNPHAKGFLLSAAASFTSSSPRRGGSHEVPSSSSLFKRRRRLRSSKRARHPSDQSEFEASMALQEMQESKP